jgi:hypothetical protein
VPCPRLPGDNFSFRSTEAPGFCLAGLIASRGHHCGLGCVLARSYLRLHPGRLGRAGSNSSRRRRGSYRREPCWSSRARTYRHSTRMLAPAPHVVWNQRPRCVRSQQHRSFRRRTLAGSECCRRSGRALDGPSTRTRVLDARRTFLYKLFGETLTERQLETLTHSNEWLRG